MLKFAKVLNSTVLGYGHLAVDVFIVLSGYCLMLPVAASADLKLRGGLIGYIKRRAWRIVPPYYAALCVALIIALTNGAYHMFSPGDVAAHLLLIHNLNPDWLYSINAPMWSIAVEWQIYFVFGASLLPVLAPDGQRRGAAGRLCFGPDADLPAAGPNEF